MMNCKEAVEYIHSLERFGIMPGLERISALCEALGNPQNDVKFIHVAGTNGKGSTCTLIANALIEAGYKTGLYTSPYVVDFRERIQLNGEMIEPDELAFCVQKVKSVYESALLPKGLKITEFEAVTAAAFLYFSRMKCDYVVLEVGLGGRFDATNIITNPDAVCIASIGLDHTAILGDTIEKIAKEKCGIIKEGAPVIFYPLQKNEAVKVILETCKEKRCLPILPKISDAIITDKGIYGTLVQYGSAKYSLKLPGKHIAYNSLVAFECLKKLGIDQQYIISGFEKTTVPARMEILGKNPVILLDGGHNEDCALALRNVIRDNFYGKKIIMVSSIMADKDYDTYLSNVAPFANEFIATKADVPRALESDKLKEDASRYCNNCIEIKNPAQAVAFALDNAEIDDIIIICGSFYLAGEVRENIINKLK